jgi:hypothetical protein
MRKGKNPDPYLPLTNGSGSGRPKKIVDPADPDPGGLKTCGSGSPTLLTLCKYMESERAKKMDPMFER